MKRHWRALTAGLLAAATTASAETQTGGAPFSADMLRRGPDGTVTEGRMFVGDGKLRMEMSQQGREVVRITDRDRRMEWILFPGDRTYLERGASGGEQAAAPAKPKGEVSAESDPCAGLPGVTCRRVGVEDVNGRPAVKWEMTGTRDGQTLTGAQWLDQTRGLPLKSVMPNGQTMELKILGSETVNGRPVEKWEMTVTAPGQQPTRTFQWYDPELKLAVRDELPGGYVSELKNIKVGPQPDDLFMVPAGYTRATAPPGGTQGGAAPQGGR